MIDAANRALIESEYNSDLATAVYEESHNLYSSKFDAMRKGSHKFTPQEQRGWGPFQGKGKCTDCHTATGQRPAFTDHT